MKKITPSIVISFLFLVFIFVPFPFFFVIKILVTDQNIQSNL